MGKKSQRPNRNKPKDIPAAASTAVAAPRQAAASAQNPNQCQLMLATFFQLLESEDWAGMLELKSEMNVIANIIENVDPS